MSTQMPCTLSSSVSGVIKPGACVSIESNETITTPEGVVAVIGIRKSLGNRKVTIGATLIPSQWSGKVMIQLINHGDEVIEIYQGDELANVAYLAAYVE